MRKILLLKQFHKGDELSQVKSSQVKSSQVLILSAVLMLFPVLSGFSQTAEFLDNLLDSPSVTYQDASYAVLSAAGIIEPASSAEAAFAQAQEKGFLTEKAEASAAIRLDEAAFLIMGAFAMKSGFMYDWFPGPRYAYRELTYRDLIQGRNDPALTVPGARLLRIIGRVLDYKGEL